MKDKIIITEESFFGSSNAVAKDYGDPFNDLYGYCSLELTKDNIIDLLNDKVLYTDVNDEYALLIRMRNDKTTGS